MKILVINTGSSSVKYKLYNLENNRVLSKGAMLNQNRLAMRAAACGASGGDIIFVNSVAVR